MASRYTPEVDGAKAPTVGRDSRGRWLPAANASEASRYEGETADSVMLAPCACPPDCTDCGPDCMDCGPDCGCIRTIPGGGEVSLGGGVVGGDRAQGNMAMGSTVEATRDAHGRWMPAGEALSTSDAPLLTGGVTDRKLLGPLVAARTCHCASGCTECAADCKECEMGCQCHLQPSEAAAEGEERDDHGRWSSGGGGGGKQPEASAKPVEVTVKKSSAASQSYGRGLDNHRLPAGYSILAPGGERVGSITGRQQGYMEGGHWEVSVSHPGYRFRGRSLWPTLGKAKEAVAKGVFKRDPSGVHESEGLGLVGEGYNPDQPRVPPGSSSGGEFAGGEGGREGGGSKDETAPKGGGHLKTYTGDPSHGASASQPADQARIGVPAGEVPPPPSVPRLPNLNADERGAETRFAEMYEKDPDGVAKEYLARVMLATDDPQHLGDGPNTFGTDDAKMLSRDYNPQGASKDDMKEARATYNVATFQTADSIAKRAFRMRLDDLSKLPEGDPARTVLVTNGGVASGKGYAAGKIGGNFGAVWDSAGETNGIENAWVHSELSSRGLSGVYLFVHQDAGAAWNGERGVLARAQKIGRVVDARLYADSYVYGPRNFQAFADAHGHESNVAIRIMDNSKGGEPTPLDRIPRAAMRQDPERLYRNAVQTLDANRGSISDKLYAAATAGTHIWGPPRGK